MFGPKRKELARSCGRLHNGEPHNFHASPKIIRVMKSRRMRWAGNVALIGMRSAYNILYEILKGRNHSEDLDIDGRIRLE
jgi:hypothetical protein